jgi:hypothetical protein
MFRWLPPGALHHDPQAYLRTERAQTEAAGATAPAETTEMPG